MNEEEKATATGRAPGLLLLLDPTQFARLHGGVLLSVQLANIKVQSPAVKRPEHPHPHPSMHGACGRKACQNTGSSELSERNEGRPSSIFYAVFDPLNVSLPQPQHQHPCHLGSDLDSQQTHPTVKNHSSSSGTSQGYTPLHSLNPSPPSSTTPPQPPPPAPRSHTPPSAHAPRPTTA